MSLEVQMNETELLAIDAGVRRTIAAYARTVDGRDMAAAARLFTDDARIQVMGEEHVGIAQVRAWLEMLGKSPAGIHLTTNTLVQPRGATEAEAMSDVAFIKQVDGAWKIVVAGSYADRLRREADGWRFVERVITLS